MPYKTIYMHHAVTQKIQGAGPELYSMNHKKKKKNCTCTNNTRQLCTLQPSSSLDDATSFNDTCSEIPEIIFPGKSVYKCNSHHRKSKSTESTDNFSDHWGGGDVYGAKGLHVLWTSNNLMTLTHVGRMNDRSFLEVVVVCDMALHLQGWLGFLFFFNCLFNQLYSTFFTWMQCQLWGWNGVSFRKESQKSRKMSKCFFLLSTSPQTTCVSNHGEWYMQITYQRWSVAPLHKNWENDLIL